MKITMLGTGNALTTEYYNTCFIISDNDKNFLIDGGGGNGILRQFKQSGFSFNDIHHIFVTHTHTDHLLGIIWVIRKFCNVMKNDTDYAYIYAHDEVIRILRYFSENLLLPRQQKLIDTQIHFVTVSDGEEKNIIGHKVRFFDIHSTKTKQFGFCMDIGNNEKLTCCGDEPYNELNRKYAENSKWLLHEAFCLDSHADIFRPYEKHHSTVKDACLTAQRLNIPNLLLYHTEDMTCPDRKELYLTEGRKFYTGNLFIPDDLETIEL